MKPRLLLDVCCGAGGCAKGYQRAGFVVIGIDNRPQPHYCGDGFVLGDALEMLRTLIAGGYIEDNHGKRWYLRNFDAIHASPPCQAYSVTKSLHTHKYPLLVEQVRGLLEATGKPFVIENVVGAPLHTVIELCGSSFGLGVRRHRWFESNCLLFGAECRHDLQPEPLDVTGTGGPCTKHRKPASMDEAHRAMGIDWMVRKEINLALPPVYAEFIGKQLIAYLDRA